MLGSPIPSTSSGFTGLSVDTASSLSPSLATAPSSTTASSIAARPTLLDSPASPSYRPRIRRRASEASDTSDVSREGSPPVTGPWRAERRRGSSCASSSAYDLPKALERSLAMSRHRSRSSSGGSVANSPVLAPSPLSALSPMTPSLTFERPSPTLPSPAALSLPHISPISLTTSPLLGGPSPPMVTTKRQRNKKLLSLNLALAVPALGAASSSTTTTTIAGNGSRSCPPSPSMADTVLHSADQSGHVHEMRSNLKGGMAMRRRPSIPRLHGLGVATNGPYDPSDRPAHRNGRPDPVRLIGRNGEAGVEEGEEAYPYERGPREILPGVYLGSEANARDPRTLRELGIGYVLNVAKEVVCPWAAESVIEEEDEEDDAALLSARLSAASSSGSCSPNLSEASISPSSVATTASLSGSAQHSTTKLTSSPPDSSIRRPRTQTLAQAAARPFLIRSTASTPNLQASFSTTHASVSASAYPSLPSTSVVPSGIQRFPPDSRTGRPGLEYLHLPWGHDEDALVARFPTAFAFIDRARQQSNGRVLVHCQCGVSRSATAVIAFVMREAANGVNVPGLESVKGMHEAYQWVKERSAWITPNMSLLFQLKEWENVLVARSSSPLVPPSPAVHAFSSSSPITTQDDDAMDVDVEGEAMPTTALPFGTTARTASERRAAHRRTFSTDVR